MKTNKLLFFIASIIFFTTFTNCSNETINDEILIDEQSIFDTEMAERKTQTKNQNNQRGGNLCADENTTLIFVQYDFPPNSTALEQSIIRTEYLNLMSSYITICETFNTSCYDIDALFVNSDHYNDYLIPNPGPGSGNNNPLGDGPGEILATTPPCTILINNP